ncbi:hypothetical protein K3495_g10127 [Podosphaera aphanis]|nr:hypothetical protein K3495_g10127 [Podosphaera aphanis]
MPLAPRKAGHVLHLRPSHAHDAIMSLPHILRQSRAALRRVTQLTSVSPARTTRLHRRGLHLAAGPLGPENAPSSDPMTIDPIDQLLATPTWSVEDLVHPTPAPVSDEPDHAALLHLLRLAALPQPVSAYHSKIYRAELHAHLRFVQDVQSVCTDGIEPLVCIRNETELGVREKTISLDDLKEALSRESVRGKCARPRREPRELKLCSEEEWDMFGASKNVVTVNGEKYFVVWYKSPRIIKDDETSLKDNHTVVLDKSCSDFTHLL